MIQKIAFSMAFVMTISIFMAGVSYAASGSIQPPKMIFRVEAPANVTGSINVMNPNNDSLNVSIKASGDITGLAQLSENEIVLSANETKAVSFDVFVPSAGSYNGEIIFSFSPPGGGTQGVALSSTIIIIANASQSQAANGTAQAGSPLTGNVALEGMLLPASITLIIVVLALASFVVYRNKRVLK